jgi:hypothetical protein
VLGSVAAELEASLGVDAAGVVDVLGVPDDEPALVPSPLGRAPFLRWVMVPHPERRPRAPR